VQYSDLVAEKNTLESIRGWINHDFVPSEACVSDAEAFIYERLRVREMKSVAIGSIPLNASSFAIPAGFISPLRLSLFSSDGLKARLKSLPDHDFEDLIQYGTDGLLPQAMPCYYATDDANVLFDCRVDRDLTYRFNHYRRLPSLSPSNQSNFLTSKYPDLLRWTCLYFAHSFRGDEVRSAAAYQSAIDAIRSANERADDQMADVHSEGEYA
jgi:hypothetical protein